MVEPAERFWSSSWRWTISPGSGFREQFTAADETGELEARHADLGRRLTAKQAEKDRYIRLYAQGHISEEELETYLLDLKNQIGNLRLLIESVEADLSASAESRLDATNTETWLMTLRERIAEIEEDTPEAYQKRRELAGLLVERINLGRDENGRARVQITYRFSPPGDGSGSHREALSEAEQGLVLPLVYKNPWRSFRGRRVALPLRWRPPP